MYSLDKMGRILSETYTAATLKNHSISFISVLAVVAVQVRNKKKHRRGESDWEDMDTWDIVQEGVV